VPRRARARLLTLGYWQGGNWDPAVSARPQFDAFCDALAAPVSGALLEGKGIGLDGAGRLEVSAGPLTVPLTVYNYGKYIKEVGRRAARG
jgi:hypothetical protein